MKEKSITIKDATLRFRIYKNRSPALKEAVMHFFSANKKRHGPIEFDAIKNLSVDFKSGERVGIIGLNGAGKSTLLKMIVGIYPPQTGEVIIDGTVTPLIELGTGFDAELSGRENIYLNGALLGHSFQKMRQSERQIIDFAELQDFIDFPVKYYSSGMHSRLAFSIATAFQPEILLIDEIFATGDAKFVRKAMEKMRQLFHGANITIMVSHDLRQIEELCNRVIILNKGEILADGRPKEMIDLYHQTIAIYS